MSHSEAGNICSGRGENEPEKATGEGSDHGLGAHKDKFKKQKESRGKTAVKDSSGRTIFQSRWDEMFARLLQFKVE